MARAKSTSSKKRRLNKAVDRRFAMRNQRAPLSENDHGKKSLMDMANLPRKRRPAKGPRRVQIGVSLPQAELAPSDPERQDA